MDPFARRGRGVDVRVARSHTAPPPTACHPWPLSIVASPALKQALLKHYNHVLSMDLYLSNISQNKDS
jgi:hypothetical protein